ncbi:MAG: beta-lactamase family protein [Oscillospiraceae bacterium]|nr:beta-lactamase family protein [Oscillospiraceae bacterium]
MGFQRTVRQPVRRGRHGRRTAKDDAIYVLRSLTKPFTATAAAILQENGEIDWLEPVRNYIPEFEGDGKDAVLIWQLLCHSSGMDADKGDEFRTAWWEENAGKRPSWELPDEERMELYRKGAEKLGIAPPESSDDYMAQERINKLLRLKTPLFVSPGTRYSYYSYGYEMIRFIIEQVSGESLETFCRRHIFDPLGMDDTRWTLTPEQISRCAGRSAKSRAYEWLNSADGALSDTSADAGLKSSMKDLTTFGQLFLRGGTLDGVRIISPASARLMIDPDADMVVAFYVCERAENSFYDDMSRVINVLYSALD